MDDRSGHPFPWEVAFRCPACDEVIDATSARCRKCGAPVEEAVGIVHRPAPNRATRMLAWALLVGGLILVAMALAVWVYARASA